MGFAKGPNRLTDSMKSTWKNSDRKDWTFHHWMVHYLNIYPSEAGKEVPVHQKTDKVPYMEHFGVHRWILYHALWPIAVQYAYRQYTGRDFSAAWAWLFYALVFQLNAIHHLWAIRRLGHTYGYFDGDAHARDDIPDHAVGKTMASLHLTTLVRPAIAIYMCYNTDKKADFSWWLPVELFLYPIVLDIFFYSYHRACHEMNALWKYHRTHHLTKHPNPLLSSYADTEQEIIEIALIPFLTYISLKAFGLPMPFHDWWICHCYILFTEAMGHSGLRIHSDPAGTNTLVLRALDCSLALEDHDLHHRHGWKSSYNYGKATRVWDRMFGTCLDRVEGHEKNIDYENPARFPLY